MNIALIPGSRQLRLEPGVNEIVQVIEDRGVLNDAPRYAAAGKMVARERPVGLELAADLASTATPRYDDDVTPVEATGPPLEISGPRSAPNGQQVAEKNTVFGLTVGGASTEVYMPFLGIAADVAAGDQETDEAAGESLPLKNLITAT